MVNLYSPFARLSEKLVGSHRKGGRKQRTPLRIYIAGPYTASSEAEIQKNVETAIDASLALYKKGHFPYVPHLTHFIDQRARQTGVQMTWEDYVFRWDSAWLALCDALLFLAESPGARKELELAQRLGKKIFYSLDEVGPADSTG